MAETAHHPPQYGEGTPTATTQPPAGPPPAYTAGPPASMEKFPQQPQYRDVGWIVPFVIQLIVMVALAIYFGSQSSSSTSSSGSASVTVNSNAETNKVFASLALSVIFPLITAALSLWVMRQYAHCLVWTSMLFGCIMCGIMAVVFFSIGGGAIVAGVFCLIFMLFNIWWVYVVRGRIPFAVATLEVCVDVIRQKNATIGVSFASIFVQAGWQVAWLFAAIGVFNKTSNATDNSTVLRIVYFFLALSYYWTAQVVSYCVFVTCSGVVAEWYFKAPNQPERATTRALTRATTTSFGSICYGAFLIAVVKSLRESAKNKRGGLGACIAACILACLQGILEIVNFWAYTYVAVYGMTYCDACRSTFELFANRGFDVIINDDLTSGVLLLMSFISAAVAGILSFVLSQYILKVNLLWVILSVVIAFWLGLIFTMCALNVISAAIAALFVCYAEDPAALANTKPDVYNKLTNAFLARYRDVGMFKTYHVY